MQIVGMDIHRSFAQVAILEDGTIIRQLRVDLVHDRLVAFAKTLSLEDEVVIEVTGNSAAVERILRRTLSASRSPIRGSFGRSPMRESKRTRSMLGPWLSCMLQALAGGLGC